MELSAMIMMITGCTIIWGGLIVCIFVAIKAEKKNKERD